VQQRKGQKTKKETSVSIPHSSNRLPKPEKIPGRDENSGVGKERPGGGENRVYGIESAFGYAVRRRKTPGKEKCGGRRTDGELKNTNCYA